jgi:hypothetical protein
MEAPSGGIEVVNTTRGKHVVGDVDVRLHIFKGIEWCQSAVNSCNGNCPCRFHEFDVRFDDVAVA